MGAVMWEFEKLEVWMDPVAREGPEAMAVDEWLLATASCPVLRVYGWAGQWASLGYFGKICEAREAYPGLDLVRRWTGGGMVDHRHDWTYTLVIPQGEALANMRGGASYEKIHGKLAGVLQREGVPCRLSAGEGETGETRCFENPVGFDLVAPDGRKLAGAGQRRSRAGLLHQGSVGARPLGMAASEVRTRDFAGSLAKSVRSFEGIPSMADLAGRMNARYSSEVWTFRR